MEKINYHEIQLTPQEESAAILEGKKKKYFREKHKEYWEALEKNQKPPEEYQHIKKL